MRQEWQTYWQHYRGYKQYVLWGLLLSLVPFLINYMQARDSSSFFPLLAAAFGMSLSISLMIGLLVGGFFAILTLMRIRTGLAIKRMPFVEVGLIGIGIVSGVLVGRLATSFLRSEPANVPPLLPTIILSTLGGIGFVLHIAYRRAREDALAMRTVIAESRYNLLEQQMRPHFLFNTLNSLAELIESGHERASEVTHSIAEIYRLILENSRAKTVSLESELDVVRRYLELEKIRFGDRLNYSINVAGEVGEVYVPSLVIQTLVENGIKHGIAKLVGGGTISVAISRADPTLCLVEVENTAKVGVTGASGGTGLANTRARLDLLYGAKHKFEVIDGEGQVLARFYFSGARID